MATSRAGSGLEGGSFLPLHSYPPPARQSERERLVLLPASPQSSFASDTAAAIFFSLLRPPRFSSLGRFDDVGRGREAGGTQVSQTSGRKEFWVPGERGGIRLRQATSGSGF